MIFDKESKSGIFFFFFFLGGGGGGGGGGGADGQREVQLSCGHRLNDKEAKSKIKEFLARTGWQGRGNRARRGVGGGVRAIILISDTLYYPYIHCRKFSSRYFIR